MRNISSLARNIVRCNYTGNGDWGSKVVIMDKSTFSTSLRGLSGVG